MKALETIRIAARARVRTLRARFGGAPGWPARLTLRVDDLDAPGELPPATLSLEAWQEHIVAVVQNAGPMPVGLVGRTTDPVLADLVRFCHRLEMPTVLRTCAAGLEPARAAELVDRGLGAVYLRVAGTTDGEQAALGETAADAMSAMAALLWARPSRGGDLHVYVDVPVTPQNAAAVPRIWEWARAQGADGLRLAPGWRSAPAASVREAIDFVRKQRGPFQKTTELVLDQLEASTGEGGPGAPRTSGTCPVGALRVELARDGSWSACPFHEGHSTGPFGTAWPGMADHRLRIAACQRLCAHPDLA